MKKDIAKVGDRVRFLNRNGYEIQRVKARLYFKEGDILTVAKVDVGAWDSTYAFEGFAGNHNTVMFEYVPTELEALQDRVDGLESELSEAIKVAFRRGGTQWVEINYPEHFKRLHEEQTRERIAPGLYRIFWKTGGSSLCAIGMNPQGDNWIAPTNWTSTSTIAKCDDWGDIERIEPIVEAANVAA